jgi:hypothetical protein
MSLIFRRNRWDDDSGHFHTNEKIDDRAYVIYTNQDLEAQARVLNFDKIEINKKSPNMFTAVQIIENTSCHNPICKAKHEFIHRLRHSVDNLDWYMDSDFDILMTCLNEFNKFKLERRCDYYFYAFIYIYR